jgi:hypothetical protein
VTFRKNDPRINRTGRPPAAMHIAATFKDLAADFPNLAPHETALLRSAAGLLFRAEHCRDAAVAHRCLSEARRTIAGLRARRAAVAAAAPKPPELSTAERVKRALAEMGAT